MDMARSIIEEKTSRIFEVMLAMAKPGRYAGRQADRRGRGGPDADRHLARCRGVAERLALCGCAAHRQVAIHFSWARGRSLPGLFRARLSALQLAFSRASPPPAKPRRTCRCTCRWPSSPTWTQLRADLPDHQRSQLALVDCRPRCFRPPRPSSWSCAWRLQIPSCTGRLRVSIGLLVLSIWASCGSPRASIAWAF